jgi:hypothetical protein
MRKRVPPSEQLQQALTTLPNPDVSPLGWLLRQSEGLP